MDPITLGLAGVGLGTSLFGQWKAGKERKKMNNQIGQWEGENKAFYNSRALGDYTQRSDAQNAIRQMREQLDRQTKRATNTQAITGGTVEQTAVAKDSANKALADATSNIAAVGQQFKDKVTDQYLNRKNQLGMMKYDTMKGNAQSGEALAQTGLNTAAGALSSLVQKPAHQQVQQKPQGFEEKYPLVYKAYNETIKPKNKSMLPPPSTVAPNKLINQ